MKNIFPVCATLSSSFIYMSFTVFLYGIGAGLYPDSFTFISHFLLYSSNMADSNESNATSNSSSTTHPFAIPTLPHNPPISVKLTDSNFLIWEQQVEATIWGYGLESYLIEDRVEIPVASASATAMSPEYLAWRRQDQRLAAWLLFSLSRVLWSWLWA